MATAATSLADTVSFAFRLISIYGQLYSVFGICALSNNKNLFNTFGYKRWKSHVDLGCDIVAGTMTIDNRRFWTTVD